MNRIISKGTTNMNRITLTLATVLSLAFTPVSAQDYNKGFKAYKAGDYTTAIKEWKPLAEQGDAYAQYNLGGMYRNGNGVLKNYSEAVKWFRLSAEQGNAYAQYNLGLMDHIGKGVLQDNQTAHMWYNIASANGHANAGEYRDELAALMTASDTSKATAMARECMNSGYKKCGY